MNGLKNLFLKSRRFLYFPDDETDGDITALKIMKSHRIDIFKRAYFARCNALVPEKRKGINVLVISSGKAGNYA